MNLPPPLPSLALALTETGKNFFGSFESSLGKLLPALFQARGLDRRRGPRKKCQHVLGGLLQRLNFAGGLVELFHALWGNTHGLGNAPQVTGGTAQVEPGCKNLQHRAEQISRAVTRHSLLETGQDGLPLIPGFGGLGERIRKGFLRTQGHLLPQCCLFIFGLAKPVEKLRLFFNGERKTPVAFGVFRQVRHQRGHGSSLPDKGMGIRSCGAF